MDIFNVMPEWLNSKSTVIISHRIKICRNLKLFPFITTADQNVLTQINLEIGQFISNHLNPEEWIKYDFSQIDYWAKEIIKEKFLIRNLKPLNTDIHIYINKATNLIILTNFKNHINLIGLYPEKDIYKNYKLLNQLDDLFATQLDYQFHPDFGYLSPTIMNTGSGLKISFLLHLPGINIANKIQDICDLISEQGFILKSFRFLEDNNDGNLFLVENNLNFGENENHLIDKLFILVHQIKEMELNTEKMIIDKLSLQIKDKIYRSWGILTNAYTMTYAEAMNLLSAIRLGIQFDLFSTDLIKKINKLMVYTLPAHLKIHFPQQQFNQNLTNHCRAEYIKTAILNGEEP